MEEIIKRARSYVIWLLARKDYSRRQLEEKLKKRELSKEQTANLLAELVEQGWYQEGTFKKMRTRQLVKRGYGPSMIKAKLGQEKIELSKEDIQTAYDELGTTSEIEIRAMIEKHQRRYQYKNLNKRDLDQKIIQALMRKGFSISAVLKELKSRE